MQCLVHVWRHLVPEAGSRPNGSIGKIQEPMHGCPGADRVQVCVLKIEVWIRSKCMFFRSILERVQKRLVFYCSDHQGDHTHTLDKTDTWSKSIKHTKLLSLFISFDHERPNVEHFGNNF